MMVLLKSCEILDELKKLGITATSEIIHYLSDYTRYYETDNLSPEMEEE